MGDVGAAQGWCGPSNKYIIPYDRVAARVLEVPVEERAHPLSEEYRIVALPRDCFDMIELRS